MSSPTTDTRAPGPRLAKLRRRRLADDVYDQIRRAILERRFAPGERLNIPDLAERFDVSPMPVRQAINRLAEAGLVEVRPRSGTFVAQFDVDEVAETFDVRRALELLAAEGAVQNVSRADLERLGGLLREMEGLAGAQPDPERHYRLNAEFHRRIVALSNNAKLVEIYEQLEAHLKIGGIHFRSHDWGLRIKIEAAEHREILEALAARRANALGDALRRHILRAKQALTDDLKASEEPAAERRSA